MNDFTVTLALPDKPIFAAFPVAQVISETVAPIPAPTTGKRAVTYNRDTLCLAVRLAGGCAECDALGKQTCDKVKR